MSILDIYLPIPSYISNVCKLAYQRDTRSTLFQYMYHLKMCHKNPEVHVITMHFFHFKVRIHQKYMIFCYDVFHYILNDFCDKIPIYTLDLVVLVSGTSAYSSWINACTCTWGPSIIFFIVHLLKGTSAREKHVYLLLNPIPTRWGRNQPLYERHVTTSVRNRVNIASGWRDLQIRHAYLYGIDTWQNKMGR